MFSFLLFSNSSHKMLLGWILLACLCGILTGFVSGVTPGLHLNLVSVVAVSLLPLLHVDLLYVLVFVMSMAVTHTIADVLASTYLGVPDENMIGGMLPAQQLVVDGYAHKAVYFTLVGSICCVFATLPLILLMYPLLEFLESIITPFLGFVLLIVIGFLIWHEKKKFLCLCIFLLSGCFGAVVLSWEVLNQPLMPLLGGLFGGAGLIEMILAAVKIPRQNKSQVSGKIDIVSVFVASFTGVLAAFLPGIGSSQAGILAGRALGDRGVESQLIVAGGINTVNMVFSIATWIGLSKARNGAVAALATLGEPTFYCAMLLILCCCVVTPLAGVCVLLMSRKICALFERVNYQILSSIILFFVICLIFYFDSWRGLLVFICATLLGLICKQLGVARHYLMGCLLLQVLVFFLQ